MRAEKVEQRYRELSWWIDDTGKMTLEEFVSLLFTLPDFVSANVFSEEEVRERIRKKIYPYAQSYNENCYLYTIVAKRKKYIEPVSKEMTGEKIKEITLQNMPNARLEIRRRQLCSTCLGLMCIDCNYEGFTYFSIDFHKNDIYQVVYFDRNGFGFVDYSIMIVIVE